MSQISPQDMANIKVLLRGALAAAAPGLVPLVALVSVNAVDVLTYVPLDRFGLAAAFVVLTSMGYLLWRGRWWAGLPALLSAAAATVYFSIKFVRPLSAYLKANDINNLGEHLWSLVVLAPSLVLILVSLTAGLVVYKGIQMARKLGPRPVSPVVWGVVILWLLLLAGDAVYQHYVWRYLQRPSDMVVRLCVGKPQLRAEAEGYLIRMQGKAVPELLAGMAVADTGLECLRQSSRQVLVKMGASVQPELLDAARAGSLEALVVLRDIGDPRVAEKLLEIYNASGRQHTPEYDDLLREIIVQLNPTIHLKP